MRKIMAFMLILLMCFCGSANAGPSISNGIGGSSGSGSGDVSKVGTPTNHQWGLWTGDGTLKGVSVTGSKPVCTDPNGDMGVCAGTEGVWQIAGSYVPQAWIVRAGTNNVLTYTGDYSLGLTLTGATSVTVPTSGTLATTTNLSSYVANSLYDAYSILYADTDNTPAALTINASTIIGRKASGGISALSTSDMKTLLGYPTTYGDVVGMWTTCSGYLKSDGTCDTPGGAGDVVSWGDCESGACGDGTSDGGTYFRLYDGTSAYVAVTAGVRTLTFAPSNADAENMTVTFGNNDNTVALGSGTGASVSINGNAAGLSGTPALPNGTTATTQSQADNSTKLATTAYVDTGLGGKQASHANLTSLAGTTPVNNGVLSYTTGGGWDWRTTHMHDDSSYQFGSATASKGYLKFLLSGSTNAKTLTISYLHTDDKTLYVPDPTTGDSFLLGSAPLRFNTGASTARVKTLSDGAATIVEEGVATGGILLGDSTPDTSGELGYASNQLSVHDGTAARDVLQVASTTITKTEYIPIAYAEDGATAPSAAAVTASTRKVKTRDFSGTADQDVEIHWMVPLDYSAGIKFRVITFVTNSTAPADTEVVAFSLAGCSIGNSDALGCTAGTAQTSSLTVSGSGYAQYDRLATSYSSAITVTDITAGESAMFKLMRLATTTDTYGQAIGVAGIEIKYQSKVNASGDY